MSKKFFLLSLCLGSVLFSDGEIALIMKNEEAKSKDTVIGQDEFFAFIDTKISAALNRHNEDIVEKLSYIMDPIAQNIHSLKQSVASIDDVMMEFFGKSKPAGLKAQAAPPEKKSNYEVTGKTAQIKVREGIFLYREPMAYTGFSCYVDYLLWKPVEDNLEFAIRDNQRDSATDSSATPTLLASDANGTYQFANLDIDSGFRLSGAYTFPYDKFECRGEYTYFSSSGTQHAYKPNDPNLYLKGTFRENVGGPVGIASSHINLTLNELELRIGKRLHPSKQILATFFMGVSGAWFAQDWNIHYTGVSGSINQISNDWSFSGAGPRLGVNLEWHVGQGISLFGLFSGSVIVGEYDFRYSAQDPTYSAYPTGVAKYDEGRAIPNVHLITGLAYGQFYQWWGFEAMLGYEANSWFGIFRLPVSATQTASGETYNFYRDGNLTLQGLTGRIRFAF